MSAGRRAPALTTTALVAVLAAALAGCTSPSTLLDAADFDGVVESAHDEDGAFAPGWTWCTELNPYAYVVGASPTSLLTFAGRTQVGATIVDRSGEGLSAEAVLGLVEERASRCAQNDTATGSGYVIEPLTGLDDDAVGWRTETGEGEHGEFAVLTLDSSHLLAVGWATDQPEPPLELDELIRLAREGVDRVGLDG